MEIAEEHHTYFVFLEIQGQTAHVVRKFEQLTCHHFFEAVNLGDAITDFDHGADFHDSDAGFKVLDLLADDFVDFVCFDWFHNSFPI